MTTKVKFEDGTIVSFRGKPTPQDIDFVAQQIKGRTQTPGIPTVTEGATKEPITEEPAKRSLLRRAGDFLTSSTQKFGKTLGTAASVIDPKTRKLREETLASTNATIDNYLKIAREEKDPERKERFLRAAEVLSDTEDVDIFNRPEYQKTAKQVYGEALGTATETLGWGRAAGVAKGAKAVTAGQTALRGAKTGGVLGTAFGASSALQENKTGIDIVKEGLRGGITGAITGGALGAVTGKISGKISSKRATKIASPKLTKAEKEIAIRQGRLKPRTFLRSEKVTPSQKDREIGKLVQEIGIKGKNPSKDATKINQVIETEATKLKSRLKDSGAIYNKNTIKGQLNKMKADKTADLIDGELRPYNNYIAKFNKLVEKKQNKGLDGLLELRQDFDKWALSNNPRIFDNKRGGAYRALTAVRTTINDYINNKAGNDIVKNSLKKQSNLYTLLDNIAEKGAISSKLQKSGIKTATKKLLPWAGGAAGVEILRRTMGGKQ